MNILNGKLMNQIKIRPTNMDKNTMSLLEDEGYIIRLAPNHHDTSPNAGQTTDLNIYVSSQASGAHKLISVTVNRCDFSRFGYHPDNEEFLLIGNSDSKPLYLGICYLNIDEFNDKVRKNTLSEDDFIMLKCHYNDPETSFFVMKANVLHGEAIIDSDLPCPSFYVTEGSDNSLIVPNWGDYELVVDNSDAIK